MSRMQIRSGGASIPLTTASSGNPAGLVVIAGATTIEGAPAGEQIDPITGTSQQSAAISASEVSLMADTLCYVAIGSNPTAIATTSYPLPANTPVVFAITSGYKVAVIGTSGILHINPVV